MASMDALAAGEHARAVSPQPEKRNTRYRPPVTPVEQTLAGIYAEVLETDHVGIDDSFFDLGGDSFSAMRAVAVINSTLDSSIAVRTLFDAPAITALSQHIDNRLR